MFSLSRRIVAMPCETLTNESVVLPQTRANNLAALMGITIAGLFSLRRSQCKSFLLSFDIEELLSEKL